MQLPVGKGRLFEASEGAFKMGRSAGFQGGFVGIVSYRGHAHVVESRNEMWKK